MENAWTVLCDGGEGMIPFTVRLLTLVWTEVPEVKSQVCQNLSKYLQKSGPCQVSRDGLARNIRMLEECTKAHLVHTTLDNFVDVMRAQVFLLRELCFAILQHIDNAITNRKTPPDVHRNHIQAPPLAHAQDRAQQIAEGWQHSFHMNRLHGGGIGTFSAAHAVYPNTMATPRWHRHVY